MRGAAGVRPADPPLTHGKPVQRAVKRIVDVLLAVLLLVAGSPVLALALLLLRLDLGRPLIFVQERTGRGMRPFRLYKLRCMVEERDADGRLTGAVRCAGIGCLLRRLSIDELPQLVNVIRGELSLIGPRPLLPRYDPWYTARELARFTVRPGLTGLAQVAGRNTVDWDRRLELDVRYVANWSLRLDLWIALRTVVVVLTGRGVARDPQASMLDLDETRRRSSCVT